MENEEKIKIPYWKKFLHGLLVKLESRISKLRKRFIVDPKSNFFITQPLKQADRFLKKLYPDDEFYRSARYAWVRPEDAKKLYLYGCARQVLKATLTLLENEENIFEKPPKGSIDTMGRAILESIIDAQNITIRRHIELLTNLINFSNYNKDEAYRIFLNLENLEHFTRRQADFRDFYESISGNIQHSIDGYSKRIKDDLTLLSISGLWFLRNDWEQQAKKFYPLMTSIRRRYMDALPFATDDEKIMMGVSYNEMFGEVSVSAHASAGNRTESRHYKFNTIEMNMSIISMLGQHIINRSNQLMGFEDSEDIMKKRYTEGTSIAPKLLQKNNRVFQPGDIVLAMGDLSEIVECKISRFGYSSCKIKFLTRPPLIETPEDWLPVAFVASILPKSQVRNFMFENTNYQNLSKEVKDVLELLRKEPDEVVVKHSKNALVAMYKDGVLIPALIKSGYLKRNDMEEEE